ncbi:MAG TPA: HAD-IIB family hydrolase [Nitrospirae bacterium]|nr:HAD-IIB family hydrolase [Nitrospirota bacterium]
MRKKLIVFTDLDGTLLDSVYSFRKALPALKAVKEKNIPLILCSSKTRAEIEHCRKKLGNKHPFISENGGGIFIPKKYSGFSIQDSGSKIQEQGNYLIIKPGAAYVDLRKAVEELRSEGFDIKGFGDMTVKEVAGLTGLKMPDAERAKQRDFDEPFVFAGKETSLKRLKQRIRSKGYNYTQGEFFHIMGDSDKGRAVEILKKLYSEQYGKITTAALGDSPNDIEMLRNVDYPVIIKKHDGSFDRRIRVKNAIKADGIGPEGWNRAVLELLETLFV